MEFISLLTGYLEKNTEKPWSTYRSPILKDSDILQVRTQKDFSADFARLNDYGKKYSTSSRNVSRREHGELCA